MFRIPVRPDLDLQLAVYSHAEPVFDWWKRTATISRGGCPGWTMTQSAVDIAEWIRAELEQFARNEGWHAVLWHEDGVAGAVGFKPVEWSSMRVEMGYWLAERYQGRGLVTGGCACRGGLRVSEWRLNRVEIRCAVENHRSAGVPLGWDLTEEGVLRQAFRVRDEYQDLRMFAMLRERWKGESDR
jgi:ribosomal-protein-serine acetyltransferase